MLSTMLTSPLDILFQWAPTLGGECYGRVLQSLQSQVPMSRWAPTLGGECYRRSVSISAAHKRNMRFQWAPTLGGECYMQTPDIFFPQLGWFQWAPTLGGECYRRRISDPHLQEHGSFQWAPTLGGECYTQATRRGGAAPAVAVSMGTHPWG